VRASGRDASMRGEVWGFHFNPQTTTTTTTTTTTSIMSAVRAVTVRARCVRPVAHRARARATRRPTTTTTARRATTTMTMDSRAGDDDDGDEARMGVDDDVVDGGDDASEGVDAEDVGGGGANEASERETRTLAREIMASESAVEVAEDDYRGNLRLFLDSADAETYDAWLPTGMFTGVTTNPAILERDGVECSVEALSALARNALEFDAVDEFQVQTWGEDSDEMWENGIALARLDPERLVVKVPATLEGIKAANALVVDGVRVTITAAYAPHQVLVAASIGANYVAPYLGRMNDAGRDGMGTIVSMQETVEELESDMRVLVASVRTAAELSKLAAKGCDTFTISEKVAAEMFSDPLTTQAALDFQSAAQRMAPKPPKKEKPAEEIIEVKGSVQDSDDTEYVPEESDVNAA
jgi:transaldolase